MSLESKTQMVKNMRLEWNPFSNPNHKQKHQVFVRLAVSLLLLGIAFRLFLSDSIHFLFPSAAVVVVVETPSPPPPSPLIHQTEPSLPLNKNHTSNRHKERCDIFTGDWIADQSGPLYTNVSCRQIEDHQNCMRNGRPDTAYLYWRWRPEHCELSRFDPMRFLEMMRNKSWAFVGDSISRNHVQSMLCILLQGEEAIEVYHDKEYRSKRWYFPSHNFTLSVIWTPFLIDAAIFEDINGVSSSEIQLHLDKLDKTWTDQYHSFDYMVVGGGKWFLKTAIYYEDNMIKGCHYCPGKNLTELGFDHAYRKAIRLVLNYITGFSGKKTVIFRTTTPDHFENGEWFSGGTCNRTVPFRDGEIHLVDVDTVMRDIELEEFKRSASTASGKGITLELLDTTHLSLLRPDGHPGPYRKFQPFAQGKDAKVQNDCLHWCLPGPIDYWNDLNLLLNLINPPSENTAANIVASDKQTMNAQIFFASPA